MVIISLIRIYTQIQPNIIAIMQPKIIPAVPLSRLDRKAQSKWLIRKEDWLDLVVVSILFHLK